MATKEDRHLAAVVGAHTSWANTVDRSARTVPARAAMDRKFLEQADGDPVRAAHLRKAYFARLALKSAQSRRAAKAAAATAEVRAELLAALAELDTGGAA